MIKILSEENILFHVNKKKLIIMIKETKSPVAHWSCGIRFTTFWADFEIGLADCTDEVIHGALVDGSFCSFETHWALQIFLLFFDRVC